MEGMGQHDYEHAVGICSYKRMWPMDVDQPDFDCAIKPQQACKDLDTTRFPLNRIKSPRKGFESIQLMMQMAFPGFKSIQLMVQVVFPGIDSNELMTQAEET